MPTTAYIGIGSNMDNPMQQVKTALQSLSTLKGSTLCRQSSMYSSDAVGPGQQNSYILSLIHI